MPIYLGNKKITMPNISKVYLGQNLVYQNLIYNYMEVYVKRKEIEANVNNCLGVILNKDNLASGQIITATYGGITKQFPNEDIIFGLVNGVDDGTPNEGWLLISTNISNTSDKMTYGIGCQKEHNNNPYYGGIIANSEIKGNTIFSGIISIANSNSGGGPTVYSFECPETLYFKEATYVGKNQALVLDKTAPKIFKLGKDVSYIDEYAFGNSNGSVYITSVTFEDTTNKDIYIHPNAFKTKSASSFNVYTYNNKSVLNYDWSVNTGITVYNNNVVAEKMATPTITLNGKILTITSTDASGTFEINLNGYKGNVDNNGLELSGTDYKSIYNYNDSTFSINIEELNGYNLTKDSVEDIVIKARTLSDGTKLGSSYSSTVSYKKYQKVEYLESTGTQWIDLEIPISESLEIHGNFNFTDTFENNMMYGVWDNFALGLIAENQIKVASGGASTNNIGITATINTNYYIYHTPSSVRVGSSDNEVSFGSGTNTATDKHLLLFACSDSNSGNFPAWYGKGIIYNDFTTDKQLGHYYTVRRLLDNQVGIFSTFNNTLYTNKGTGEFIAGNNV